MCRGGGLGGRMDHRCVHAAVAGDRPLTLNDGASGCAMATDAATRATATLNDGSLAGNDGSLAGAGRRRVLRGNATAVDGATIDRVTAVDRSAAADRSAAPERCTFLTEDAALGSAAGPAGQGAAPVGSDAGSAGQAAATVGTCSPGKRATGSDGRGTAASPRGGGPAGLSPQTRATRKSGSRRLRCCVASQPAVTA